MLSLLKRSYTILEPVLFNVSINHLDAGVECALSKFADDTNLGGAVNSLRAREALQRDLGRIEGWAITSHMIFDRNRCQLFHLAWGNPGYAYELGDERLDGEQPCGNTSGGLG